MPIERVDTLVIGGGQAGLAMSHCLRQRGLAHLVLERGRIAERWRSERWDGLHFRPKRPIVFSENFLMLRYAENPGAAFGLFRRLPPGARGPLFHLVSIGAVVLITVYYLRLGGTKQERWALIGLPLVLGGAIGNWVDRLARGFVIDFIEAHWKDVYTWPSFNVADSAIVVGVILLLIDGMVRRDRKPAPTS